MPTVEELTVAIKEEGMDETTEGLEQVEDKFEETSEEVGDSADEMEGFASKWKGAMGAIVAGIAVATGGLLTQVPVLGEVVGGIEAIVGGLAYQLDQALRPALQPVTEDLFELSNEIYKSDGVLEGLDAIAEKAGALTFDAITFAVEEDVLQGLTDDIIKFIFPRIGETDIITALFSFDLSAAAVLTAIFGAGTIAASKILSFLLPATITSTTLLSFVLPVIATAAVLSHVFDVNMTETAILGAIFGSIIIGAAAVVGAITWPVIAGAAIVGTLFAGVVITAGDILEEIFGDEAVKRQQRLNVGGSQTLAWNRGEDRVDLPGVEEVSPGDTQQFREEFNATGGGGGDLIIDGRNMTEQTGRYRLDPTTRRGRGP